MLKNYADQELAEYKVIGDVDREQKFYLGKPIKCKVKNTPSNRDAIAKCSNGYKFLEKLSRDALLVMDFGGVNLADYAETLKLKPNTHINQIHMNDFWVEAHRLLRGLQIFLENGILHHDLKPQNVVYNEETNRLNFIDFGLMTNVNDVIQKSKRSINGFSVFHWSFPFELEHVNHDAYDNIASKSKKQKDKHFMKLIDNLNKKSNDSHTNTLLSFFSFVIDARLPAQMYKGMLIRYMTDYKSMLDGMQSENYNEFLNKSVRSIDIYGMGIAFMHLLVHSSHLIDEKLASDFMILFYDMLHPNVNERITMEPLITRYEEILESNGLLVESAKHFENHELIDNAPLSPQIAAAIDAINPAVVMSFDPPADLLMATPNPCPENKEMNVITKKCVKKCKEGYSRNAETGRCNKIRIAKMPAAPKSARREKACPDGKVLNPKTNRCVKNPNRSKTVKVCPEGKILNPLTNRCVKQKK
jgi:serine/threonine protein kinase